MKLFRDEAIEAQRRRLWGDVRLSHPPSLALWTGVLALVCAALFSSLVLIQFTRRETVSGTLVPVGGVIQVVAPRSGLVTAVNVAEGEKVEAGHQLFELADASNSVAGGPVLDAQLAQIEGQSRALVQRRDATRASIASDQIRLSNQIAGAEASRSKVDASIAVQADVVRLAEQDLQRLTSLHGEGFAPRSEVDRRRRQVLLERGTLINLEAELGRLTTSIGDLHGQLDALPARLAGELAVLDSEDSSLSQRRAELELLQRQSIRAPVAGTVSYQTALAGQVVATGQPLLSLIPDGARLEAQLFVPTRAAGFLRAGQRTRLQIQAFPFQRFGFVEGEVRVIARSVSAPGDPSLPSDIKEPVYRIRVRLKQQAVRAYGLNQDLQAGMLLKADVETDRRRLWEQLFEPLLAAGRLASG